MLERYANVLTASDGRITTLAAAITTAGGTSITTAAPAPEALHDGQFRIRVDEELMLVTEGQDGTAWIVERGVEGTVAATHANGANVRHVLTAASLQARHGGAVEVVFYADGAWPERPQDVALVIWSSGPEPEIGGSGARVDVDLYIPPSA